MASRDGTAGDIVGTLARCRPDRSGNSNRLHIGFCWRKGGNRAHCGEFIGSQFTLQSCAELPLSSLMRQGIERRADNHPCNSSTGQVVEGILQVIEVPPQHADYFLVELTHTASPCIVQPTLVGERLYGLKINRLVFMSA